MQARYPDVDLPLGGLHAAEDDEAAGQGRLHAVLHLLHLAQHQGGADRVPDRADAERMPPVHAAEFLRQHAGHQPVLPADERAAGLPGAARPGRDACGQLRRLQRLRAVRGGGDAGQGGVSRLREVRDPGLGLGPARAYPRRHRAAQPASARTPALQHFINLAFYNAWNDKILYYGKRTADLTSFVLVAVNLDPHDAQGADFEVPLWEFGLPDDASIAARGPGHRQTVSPGPARSSTCVSTPTSGPTPSGGFSGRRARYDGRHGDRTHRRSRAASSP